MPDYLDDSALERSSIVANSRMNRQRSATGANSYEKELGFSPIKFLIDRASQRQRASWLDLCCGRGRALLDCAAAMTSETAVANILLHGVDLVDAFDQATTDQIPVRLETASLHHWKPASKYDLITCVHGLHYIGDKLSLVENSCHWLENEGMFVAQLDLDNLRGERGESMSRMIARRLRRQGMQYCTRQRRVSYVGDESPPKFGHRYLGADDLAGPNYTGQEAVNSFYSFEQ